VARYALTPGYYLLPFQGAYETEINGYSADEDSYNGDSAALDAKQNALNSRE
jgi:hypothetical protein